MTREQPVQLSREMAFALPRTRMVVLVQREMRMEWVIEAGISRIWPGESWCSISHLLPSSSFLGGFLVRMDSGLGFLLGPRPPREVWEEERTGALGTGAWARREGFLWVWAEGSTFLRCEVTSEPREIWPKTAPMSDVLEVDVVPLGGIGGGGGPSKAGSGGGGGGGGGAGADDDGGGVLLEVSLAWTSWRAFCGSIPLLFQVTPLG